MANRVVQDALHHLIEDLRETHGDNLASVMLYGSVAAGDAVDARSDYNLVVALNSITPEDLRLAQAPMREWRRLGHSVPVYFTVEELRDSADVFPIEFHQMQKARRVLYGQDPLQSLRISDENLRHQAEYELRSKLTQLRRLYIPASTSAEKLSALMGDSLASFAALFRAVLLLSGHEPPVAKADSVRATVKLLNLDGEPFERIFELREKGVSTLTDTQANNLFSAYMAQIEQVIEAVDQMPGHAQAAGM